MQVALCLKSCIQSAPTSYAAHILICACYAPDRYQTYYVKHAYLRVFFRPYQQPTTRNRRQSCNVTTCAGCDYHGQHRYISRCIPVCFIKNNPFFHQLGPVRFSSALFTSLPTRGVLPCTVLCCDMSSSIWLISPFFIFTYPGGRVRIVMAAVPEPVGHACIICQDSPR